MDNKQNKKKNLQNEVDKEYAYASKIANQVNMMSLSRKLFVLREAIDLLALGQPINQLVIDMCYDDLQEAVADYKFMQEELEGYQQLMNQIQDSGVDEVYEEGATYSSAASIENDIRKMIGDKYDDFLSGIDKLNEKNGSLLNLQLYPGQKGIKIKVWDDKEALLKRVYDDPQDLALNYERDIETAFKYPKAINISNKKLSSNKKENKE